MPKICRRGNSLRPCLPKGIAAAAGLVPRAFVKVRLLDDGSLRVTPVAGKVAFIRADGAVKPLKSTVKW